MISCTSMFVYICEDHTILYHKELIIPRISSGIRNSDVFVVSWPHVRVYATLWFALLVLEVLWYYFNDAMISSILRTKSWVLAFSVDQTCEKKAWVLQFDSGVSPNFTTVSTGCEMVRNTTAIGGCLEHVSLPDQYKDWLGIGLLYILFLSFSLSTF